MLSVLEGCASSPRAQEVVTEKVQIENVRITESWNNRWMDIKREDDRFQWGVLAYLVSVKEQRRLQDELETRRAASASSAAYSTREGTLVDGYALITLYSDWSYEIMTRIMDCESSGQNIRSHYPDGDGLYSYGPFQIHGEPEVLDSPEYGAERAHEKYLDARSQGKTGYEPWSCYTG